MSGPGTGGQGVDGPGFDWPVLMRAGMIGLGLTPDRFWGLTPAELWLMLGQGGGEAPMNRAGLAALQAAYPDQNKGDGDETAGRI